MMLQETLPALICLLEPIDVMDLLEEVVDFPFLVFDASSFLLILGNQELLQVLQLSCQESLLLL